MFSSPIRLSSPYFRYVAVVFDITIIFMCAWLVSLWHKNAGIYDGVFTGVSQSYSLLVLVASLLFILLSSGVYRSWRKNELTTMLGAVVLAWLSTVLALVVGLFLYKASSNISRLWFGEWALSVMLALCLQRLLVYSGLRWLRQCGYNYKSVLLVGLGPLNQQVRRAVAESAWSGLRVQAEVAPDDLAAFLAQPETRHPDEVWLCLSLGDSVGIETALRALRHSTVNIHLVPDWFALKLINHGVSQAVGITMLDLSTSINTGWPRLVKGLQDAILGSLILIAISPLMVAIAVAVKLTSPGPVLFRQRRTGWGDDAIWVYKFRSMVVHQATDSTLVQASKNDARITPLGAFLRRTSLDELPQFINVLQGRMSIVGPRPHAVEHNDYYKELVPGYMLRHKVKPGITGWAQVNGFRGETDTLDKMQNRVDHDLYYIEHMSLWLDLKIIFLTIFKGFVHRNAF